MQQQLGIEQLRIRAEEKQEMRIKPDKECVPSSSSEGQQTVMHSRASRHWRGNRRN